MFTPRAYHLDVDLRGAFGNLYRQRHVLIAVLESGDAGRVLLGEKDDFYPPGICRLPGGGVENGEDFLKAAGREMGEELGITVPAEDFRHLADITVHARTGDGDFTLLTRLFGYRLEDARHLRPGSDLSGIVWMSFAEVEQLVVRYLALPDDFWYDDGEGYRHRWGDYGKVYGPVHRCCIDALGAWLTSTT